MPAKTVLLVLLSALAHAVWNAVLKRTRDPEKVMVGMMLVASTSGALVALVLGVPFPPPKSALACLVSGVLEAGYFVTLARALSRAPLGTVYTLARGGSLLIVWPVSVAFLGETVNAARAAGTSLVLLGLTAAGAAGRAEPSDGRRREIHAGLVYAAVCAIFIGGYNIAYKVALASGGAPAALNALSLGTATMINVVTLGARRGPALAAARAEPLAVVVGGTLATVGFLMFLLAMKDAGAGVVVTLRNTSILFAQLLSFALGERPTARGLAGAALVTAGAVLLAF
jgi:drug/metabolite transporter (DMT)-like permease